MVDHVFMFLSILCVIGARNSVIFNVSGTL